MFSKNQTVLLGEAVSWHLHTANVCNKKNPFCLYGAHNLTYRQVGKMCRCVVLTSEPLNPVVLDIIPKCPEGKHGNMQNMAMYGTRRGSMGRLEREREVVMVSQTLFFFTSVSSSFSSSLALENVLLESVIHRFLQLSSPLFCGLLALNHFLDRWDHFQTCAVMCAELGVVEPPICWLLYLIMPLVL